LGEKSFLFIKNDILLSSKASPQPTEKVILAFLKFTSPDKATQNFNRKGRGHEGRQAIIRGQIHQNGMPIRSSASIMVMWKLKRKIRKTEKVFLLFDKLRYREESEFERKVIIETEFNILVG